MLRPSLGRYDRGAHPGGPNVPAARVGAGGADDDARGRSRGRFCHPTIAAERSQHAEIAAPVSESHLAAGPMVDAELGRSRSMLVGEAAGVWEDATVGRRRPMTASHTECRPARHIEERC